MVKLLKIFLDDIPQSGSKNNLKFEKKVGELMKQLRDNKNESEVNHTCKYITKFIII